MKFGRFALAAACSLALFGMGKLQTKAADGYTSCITITNSLVKQYLFENFDTNHDKYLSQEEVDAITAIDVNGLGISSLKEIQEMPNLKTLDCRYNFLKELDVSKNPKLTSLKCSYNYLEALDVSSNTKLKTLYCVNNYIQKLSLSKNTALTNLRYGGNEISAISLKNNTAVSSVTGGDNRTYIEMVDNGDGTFSFDLNNLPGSFVVSRASKWSAGTRKGSVITVPAGTEEVTYKYSLNDVNGTFSDTFTLVCVYPVKINEKNFPDEGFRKYIQKYYDDGDGILTFSELKNIDYVHLNDDVTSSMKGIEYLFRLDSLRIWNPKCDEIDLSHNPRLEQLIVYGKVGSFKMGNKIHLKLADLRCRVKPSELNLAKMPLLITLWVFLEEPGNLSLNDHAHLKDVMIHYLDSASLNLANTPKLTKLSLGYVKLDSLVPGADCGLQKLTIYDSEVGLLDVSAAKHLTELEAYEPNPPYNKIKTGQLVVGQNSTLEVLNCKGSGLKTLDLSGASALTELDCSANQLTSLILPAGTALKKLDCHNNKLTKIDLMAQTGLEIVDCSYNELKGVNVAALKKLLKLDCHSNYLTTIDLSKNKKLQELAVSYNLLTVLSLQNNPNLETVDCGHNKLQTISFAQDNKLKELSCVSNDDKLTNLDVSMCSNLEKLWGYFSALKKVNVKGCSKLQILDLGVTRLEEIDLSTNTELESLDVGQTSLKDLNLENNLKLKSLDIHSTGIRGVDVRKQTELEHLELNYCDYVQLGKKPKLTTLEFYYYTDSYVSLDLSGCTALSSFEMEDEVNWVNIAARKNEKNQYVYDLKQRDPYFNGSKVRNLKGGTLSGSVLTTVAGEKEVSYDYDAGNGYTLSVEIEFRDSKMSIENQPVDVVIEEGKTGSLTVKVKNAVAPTYQWQKSTDYGISWANCSSPGAKTDTMTLTGSLGLNKLLFRCVITDTDGVSCTTDPVTAKVWGSKPVIASQTEMPWAYQGDDLSMSVEAYGNGITYQWQKSADNGETWSNCISDGAKTATMTTTAKKSLSSLLFRCVVKDINGKTAVSDIIIPFIAKTPVVTRQSSDIQVKVGRTVQMYVYYDGAGDITFQWMKSQDGGVTWKKVAAGSGISDELRLTATAGFDGMLFKCILTDGHGNTCESKPAMVIILPELTVQPTEQTVEAGTEVKFFAEATGAGLAYQWKKSTDGGKTWVNSSSEGAKTNTLTMTTKASYNGLQFKCVITDKHGQVLESKPVVLTVTQKLAITGQPANVSVKAGSTATFKVTANGIGLTYKWKKSTDGGKTWVNSSSEGAKTNTLTMTTKASYNGLQFKCIVTDQDGNSVESNAVALTVN